MSKDNNNQCSFCKRNKKICGTLVEGKEGRICRDCSNEVQSLLIAKHKSETIVGKSYDEKIPTPKELVEELNKYVIGQTDAKRALAISVYLHLKKIKKSNLDEKIVDKIKNEGLEDVEDEKSNVLIIGPTGCGKTLIAKTLANYVGVPFAIGDATTLTESGYVGEDVENLLLKLIRAADMDVNLAEKGILFIDEIDKIGKTGNNVSITRDVSGEGVQQSLLKIIEGTDANVPPMGGRKHPEQEFIHINTNNILFICGGTFTGIEKNISKRLSGNKKIGFGIASELQKNEYNRLLPCLEPEDLIEYGLIPEFIGRLPKITGVKKLNEEDFIRILTEPKNSLIKQKKKLFIEEGANLEFENEAITEIAVQAIKKDVGARALKSVIDKILDPWIFDLPDTSKKQFVVTKDLVLDSIGS